MVTTGLDKFLKDHQKYKNRHIGLIVNQTSLTRDFVYSWVALNQTGFNIRKIFSPEHGLFATEQDQIPVENQPDVGFETVSLYGNSEQTLIPDPAMLDDIDTLIFDIQDVGSRYYTYVNTMAMILEVIQGRDIEFVVLDRPNPLGGATVEGPDLKPDFKSFVGVFNIPVRHGLTAGELATLYTQTEKLDVNLNVIPMQGWNRSMLFNETGLTWIPPSPNMPTLETAMVYPGMCLFEGLNISEGRGTTTPFELFGADFTDPEQLDLSIRKMELQGVAFRPYYFIPTFHKYKNKIVGGLYIHVTDRTRFQPFLTGIALTKSIYDLYPGQLELLKDVYEFNSIHPTFDLLTGSNQIRDMILNSATLQEIQASWLPFENEFLELKKGVHLYGD